jgi:putative ABC transport system permease protein
MLRVAVRGAAAHRVRLVSTALAVLLSVAFMSGTQLLGDTIRTSLGELWSDAYGRIDVVVRSDRTVGLDGEGNRDRLPVELLDQVRAIEGVAAAEGSIQAQPRILRADGEPLRDARVGAATWMLDWPEVPALNGWELVEGRPPDAAGEVVLDPTAADEGGYRVGDPMTFVVAGEPITAAVVGVATFGGGASYGGVPVALAEEGWLASVAGEPGRVDRVDVVAAEGTTPEELVARLGAAGLAGTEVLVGTELTEERRSAIGEVVDLFVQLVSAFGAIALFVGAFLIVNTFTIIVTQRTRELALLRALGASRGQVLGAVVAEALLVAVVAAAAGALLSVPVAVGLRALVERFGFPLPATSLVVSPGAFVLPVVLAVVVTCAAALVPALRASRTPAVEAMRRATVEQVRRVAVRLGLGALLASVAVLLVVRAMGEQSDLATAIVLAAAVPAIVAVAVAGPVFTPPLVSWLAAPLAALTGLTGRLARRNALRNPGRTSSTAAALMIGVSLVVVIMVASASLASTVSRVVAQTVQGDFVVSADRSGVSIDVAPELAALPEVGSALGVRLGSVGIDGSREFVLAVDPAAAASIVDLDVSEGDLAELGLGTVAVARTQADRDGVALGDEVQVSFPFGAEEPVRVVAIYERGLTRNGEFLFAHDGWDPFLPPSARVDARVLVAVADGVPLADAEVALGAAVADRPGTELLAVGEYRDQQVDEVVSRISFLYVLLGLALVVGLLGIANTLLLGVHERTRELGLLRTVGAQGRQLGSTILQEAVVIAALGAVLGVGLGVVLGWAMVDTLRFDDRIEVDVPWLSVIGIGVLAVVAGAVAGLVPARRASRLAVLDAIAEE